MLRPWEGGARLGLQGSRLQSWVRAKACVLRRNVREGGGQLRAGVVRVILCTARSPVRTKAPNGVTYVKPGGSKLRRNYSVGFSRNGIFNQSFGNHLVSNQH